jgi:inorganic pyrophosphatase
LVGQAEKQPTVGVVTQPAGTSWPGRPRREGDAAPSAASPPHWVKRPAELVARPSAPPPHRAAGWAADIDGSQPNVWKYNEDMEAGRALPTRNISIEMAPVLRGSRWGSVKKLTLLVFAIALPLIADGQIALHAPEVLPATATAALRDSLKAAEPHQSHVWRDTAPVNSDSTINAYIEIARGDRRKWEFDMAAGVRTIDRMIPEDVGGYPINYGFVPQTISYDGDPFDALVLGPPLPGGRLVRGIAVGVIFMEDEKGLDSKVVLSPLDAAGRPLYRLTESIQREVASYFRRYKQHEPGAFSRVTGWGPAADGVALVRLTHAFFQECRGRAGSPCTLGHSGR